VQGLWAALLTLSGTYSDLLDYVISAALVFYVLTIAGLLRLRRRRPEAPRPYRIWAYPWLPVVYLLLASLIAVDLLVSAKTRGNTLPGLAIVLSGIPVYALWRRQRLSVEETPRAP
jgi:APA family basic amino acid/polyamine antiporter